MIVYFPKNIDTHSFYVHIIRYLENIEEITDKNKIF